MCAHTVYYHVTARLPDESRLQDVSAVYSPKTWYGYSLSTSEERAASNGFLFGAQKWLQVGYLFGAQKWLQVGYLFLDSTDLLIRYAVEKTVDTLVTLVLYFHITAHIFHTYIVLDLEESKSLNYLKAKQTPKKRKDTKQTRYSPSINQLERWLVEILDQKRGIAFTLNGLGNVETTEAACFCRHGSCWSSGLIKLNFFSRLANITNTIIGASSWPGHAREPVSKKKK